MKEKDKLKHEPIVNQEDETIFSSPDNWMTVKKNKEFYYAERKGVDSIAFVLFAINAEDTNRIGVLKEFKQPVNKSVITAFGGSIDDEKYHDDLYELVIDEVVEESGFKVSKKDIQYYGKVFVSTQMNQFCHLFGVTVNKFLQGLRTTTNPQELNSIITWLTPQEVFQQEDWKTIVIVSKRLVADPSLIQIKPLVATAKI